MALRSGIGFALLVCPLVAVAGLFSVSPIRVDLTPQTKAGSVAVTNDGAALILKIKLMRWTQDAEGVDQYSSTNDLVYFPRELVVEPGATRAIRVLSSNPPSGPEKAYRLFIEEQQPPQDDNSKSSRLSVLVKFGVAVYTYAKEMPPTVSIEVLKAEAGKASLLFRNTSAAHIFVKEITSPEVTFTDFKPRYVLGGAGFALSAALTPGACARGALDVSVATAEGPLNAALLLPATACN